MKKFLININIFVIPIVMIMVISDYFISNNLKNSHNPPGEIEVWNDIYIGDITADIAIYGSSRAYRHINPSIIKDSLNFDAYNFGMSGHNFWLQYLRHEEYFRFNKKPKFIILSVDIFSLQKRKDLFESNQFLPFMLWNKNIIKYTSSYIGFTKGDYYVPLVRYSGTIRKLENVIKFNKEKSLNNMYRKNGYNGAEREWNNDLEQAKIHTSQYKINIDSSSVNLLDQFLTESKKNNVKIILVYTPEYIGGQKFVENRMEIINIYKDFSKKHNLLFLDYSKDDISRQKELFYNSLHLNKMGAEIFTRKLCIDLKWKMDM